MRVIVDNCYSLFHAKMRNLPVHRLTATNMNSWDYATRLNKIIVNYLVEDAVAVARM